MLADGSPVGVDGLAAFEVNSEASSTEDSSSNDDDLDGLGGVAAVKEDRHRRALQRTPEHVRRVDGERVDDEILVAAGHLKKTDAIRVPVKTGRFKVHGHPGFSCQALAQLTEISRI